ncbi:hypothetical protein L2E82_27445 [Cichorium intybus]|uniref:Uncharacterized protein n=1 Tax=Cichorium intybus TaxID=13427 RepID=A0ACB9CTM2_CICIN|nr:hypothetical protein L2E82_27445 [Cichorium intybus]
MSRICIRLSNLTFSTSETARRLSSSKLLAFIVSDRGSLNRRSEPLSEKGLVSSLGFCYCIIDQSPAIGCEREREREIGSRI